MNSRKEFINKELKIHNDNLINNNIKLSSVKMLNLNILINCFFIIWVICFIYYLSSDLSFKKIPIDFNAVRKYYDPQQTAGAIALYSVIWYVALNILFFYYLLKMNLKSDQFALICFGSFFINPWSWIWFAKQIQNKREWVLKTFYYLLDENNKITFNIKNPKAIIGLISFLVFIPFLFFSSTEYIVIDTEKKTYLLRYTPEIWLNNLHFFTTQGNWICLVISLIFFINPHARITKKINVLIISLSFILTVGTVWLFILFPIFSKNEHWTWFNNLTGFYDHVVTPIIFSILVLISIKFSSQLKQPKYHESFVRYIFYVIIYAFYVSFLPVISNVSVYGKITDFWPSTGGNILFICLFFGLIGYQILIFSMVWGFSKLINKTKRRLIN